MDNLLNDFFNEVSFGKTDFHQHRHIHEETDEGYEYKLNLAGFKRENIKVNVEKHARDVVLSQWRPINLKPRLSKFQRKLQPPRDFRGGVVAYRKPHTQSDIYFLKNFV